MLRWQCFTVHLTSLMIDFTLRKGGCNVVPARMMRRIQISVLYGFFTKCDPNDDGVPSTWRVSIATFRQIKLSLHRCALDQKFIVSEMYPQNCVSLTVIYWWMYACSMEHSVHASSRNSYVKFVGRLLWHPEWCSVFFWRRSDTINK